MSAFLLSPTRETAETQKSRENLTSKKGTLGDRLNWICIGFPKEAYLPERNCSHNFRRTDISSLQSRIQSQASILVCIWFERDGLSSYKSEYLEKQATRCLLALCNQNKWEELACLLPISYRFQKAFYHCHPFRDIFNFYLLNKINGDMKVSGEVEMTWWCLPIMWLRRIPKAGRCTRIQMVVGSLFSVLSFPSGPWWKQYVKSHSTHMPLQAASCLF